MENDEKNIKDDFIKIIKQKEESDRFLLNLEIVIFMLGLLFFTSFSLVAIFVQMADWLKFTLIGYGLLVFIITAFIAIKIEQIAGFYECKNCHHRYIPTYKQAALSMHIGRTKYMKCPKCGKKSWNKKVLLEKDIEK